MYRFPAYIDDPLILFHAKFLKYAALVSTFFIVIEYQYVISKMISTQKDIIERQNQELREQKEEILRQKEEIQAQRDIAQQQYKIIAEQKKHITDGIVYASTIQRSLLPEDVDVLEGFEYFIFYRPKEIVSGDFYWFYKRGERIIIAAADCTGHGVPGAFMSLLGITYLNDIMAKTFHNIMPHEILEELRSRIIKTFERKQGGEERKDGMDIAIYIIEPDRETLHFAGANNPLYIVRAINNNNFPSESEKVKIQYDNEFALIQIKPDKMPVGNFKAMKPFTSQTIKIMSGDTFYTFSDGIIDQFGGERGKRMGSARFKKLILSMQGLSMHEQKTFIERAIDDWMKQNPELNLTQLDDMLLLGLKMP